MTDRRKEMWRLLYSLVNRNDTQVSDVFVLVDDILCNESSLIVQSSKDATNNFQDAFIMWLVNKLVGSLDVDQGNGNEIYEMNLKTQCKLLNSCLLNRSCLFELVVKAYVEAIDQLSDLYAKVDTSAESVDTDLMLRISAFSTQHNVLHEIDPEFRFPVIEVHSDLTDNYIQALLQVLHHGIFVGFINYPVIFEDSAFSALKAVRVCDIRTKVNCIRYVGRVFQKAIYLSHKLYCIYDMTFRALTAMWNHLPIWLSNQYLQQDVLDNFIEESANLIAVLYNFVGEVRENHAIESYCFQLLESVYEVHQWKGLQKLLDKSKMTALVHCLIDFIFCINVETISESTKINPTYMSVLMKVLKVFPIVLRAIAPHLMLEINEDVLLTLIEFVASNTVNLLREPSINTGKLLVEYLTFLVLLDHLFKWNIEIATCYKTELKVCKYLRKARETVFKTFSTDIMRQSLDIWMSKLQSKTDICVEELQTFGLLLEIDRIVKTLVTPNMRDNLIEKLLNPMSLITKSVREENFDTFNMEMSIEILVQIQELVSYKLENIRNHFLTLGKFLFSLKNKDLLATSKFSEYIPIFIVNNWLTVDIVLTDFLRNVQSEDICIAALRSLACLSEPIDVIVIKSLRNPKRITEHKYPKMAHMTVECHNCARKVDDNFMAVICQSSIKYKPSLNKYLPPTLNAFVTQHLFTNPRLSFMSHHLDFYDISVEDVLNSLFAGNKEKRLDNTTVSTIIAKYIKDKPDFLTQLSSCLLKYLTQSLKSNVESGYQRTILSLISSCTQTGTLSEQWLFHFFKMTFFFLIHPESKVVHEAILCASEMCIAHNTKPIHLWNWYKRDALNLIVRLMIYVYLSKGIQMTNSLNAFTKMLGFSCVEEFVCKYYRYMVTTILPYCIKDPRCKGLIIRISKITRKTVVDLFVVSFLRIYTHIYLTEDVDVGNACIELLGKCTGSSLSKLMKTDIQQTVCELLVYFNRNPTFVMQAFQCLLPNEEHALSSCLKSPTYEFTEFIKPRFLGVITYFQTCLAETYFEKSLKEETLYSLGQVMRLIGSNSVTQFRFKIIAMLSFVLTIEDRSLQNICLKIWNIFLHIVNTQVLGPSLSRIVASLLPLIDTKTEEINDIYDYLILKNDSLLGIYIPDLYFLEGVENVKPAIKQSVARQTDLLKKPKANISQKLSFLYKQICNENLQVRIYGLNYLANFIVQWRREINHMILGTIPMDPLIERIVDELIKGCRHEDRNMHLASAKCLGELGAIDPSYMSSSFSFLNTSAISLSIHTDDFARMALTELCRAYQFQKDSKYVDNFSLAIQETLSAFGISPEENKKLNVWDTFPTRMQQIMKPLLSSCYTGSKRQSNISEHPLFNSSCCRSYEEWSFAWACRLIDLVEREETRHLFNSYKLSMKRDSNILVIFFPYILLHVLQECRENGRRQIIEEFMAVFNFCSRDISLQTEVDTFGFKEFNSTKYSADGMSHRSLNCNGIISPASEQFEAMETIIQTCTKLCSEQIDFLQRWVREWQKANPVSGEVRQENENYKAVTEFLGLFNKSLIAKANFNSGEYARALLYLEEYIEENASERLQDQLSFLIQIHGKLMDSDSVEGAVYMKKTSLSLEEEILVNRIVDRPQETITCYEQLLSKGDSQINQDHIKGIIDCYLRMDTPETALLITDGLWQKLADQYTDDYFKECKSELLWRLGRYDELQELLEDTVVKRKTSNWNIQCAESFLLFRQPCTIFETFVEQLDVIRSNIMSTMRSCSFVAGSSYTHSYDEATRLHLLNEVEKNKHLIIQMQSSDISKDNIGEEGIISKMNEFFNNWNARLEVLQPTARVLEPILCFRRNLLLETKRILLQDNCNKVLVSKINKCIDEQIVNLWLRSIQMNRKSGCLQQAQISIMKAEQYKPETLFLEKAKLMWQKGDQTNCFKLLQKNINMLVANCDGVIRKLDRNQRDLYAKAKFLQACYNAESMNICPELNLAYFKEAVEANQKSEKFLVCYAQYMEKIYDTSTKEQRESESCYNVLIDIMVCYAKSLKYGCANVYQSLPRLLSIWLNFTSQQASSVETNQTGSVQSGRLYLLQGLVTKMNELISSCVTTLSASIFYTAFSQLLSRICHPSSEVFGLLKDIIIKLIEHFPQQSLWMLLPIFKSCHTSRVKRCRHIFTDGRLNKSAFQKLLSDFNMLAERLIELTNKELAIDRSYELSTLVRQLPRLFLDRQFSNIMLPFEKYMQASFPVTLSAESFNTRSSSSPSADSAPSSSMPSNPFPSCVYISGIKEEVVVLRSAAKPKKITIECSDGLFYDIMVKPKDDLRKDFRLMEFNGLVKRYLHQDPQARYRRLRIRTYAAIPFNEECGLVEWLPNLNSFRGICMSYYRMRGLGIPEKSLRKYALPKTDPIQTKRSIFNEVLLPRHPPIFHLWFRQRFPSPHSWYQARSAYVKTVAVMSMVGYILGLGDRHGENILFDETNGDAVHVDFNCLFNQGELFAYPEVVPFRLTGNMTFAMGPLGVEGLFRKCCEISLRVLKGESKTLMSVLRPFVYDIGSINRLKGKTNSTLEITDPKAIIDVKRIEERLQGYVKRSLGGNLPLSIEGQVNFLINEATEIDNLASMYIGWGPYI